MAHKTIHLKPSIGDIGPDERLTGEVDLGPPDGIVWNDPRVIAKVAEAMWNSTNIVAQPFNKLDPDQQAQLMSMAQVGVLEYKYQLEEISKESAVSLYSELFIPRWVHDKEMEDKNV